MFRSVYFAAALLAALVQWPTPASAQPVGDRAAVEPFLTGTMPKGRFE